MKKNKLSIIIPNYNGRSLLLKCVESIKKYNNFLCDKIYIVDNGSIDGSYEEIKSDNFIEWIPLYRNYGFSRAVNEGIKRANSEYILLLNNDTEIEVGFLDSLISIMNNKPNIFSVSSKMIQYHNRHLIDNTGDLYSLLGWTYQQGHGFDAIHYNQSCEIFSACAGAAIYRRSILEEIGYFDENFFAYMEDVDIGYRARIHGYKNVYCPEAIVYHIGSATSGSKYNAFKVRLAARNNIYVPYKNMPWLQLFVNLPFLILGFFIKYNFFVMKGFGKEYREGIWEGLTTLSKVEKVKFQRKNLWNYFKIEGLLIKNTFKYFFSKIFRT